MTRKRPPNQQSPQNGLLGRVDLAPRLGLSDPRQVDRYRREGKFPKEAVRKGPGGRWLYDWSIIKGNLPHG